MEKIRIGVIFGGRSGEHEVSLQSARSVLSALDSAKYAVTQIGITQDGQWLAGEGVLDALDALAQGRSVDFSGFSRAAILPDPTRLGLYVLHPADEASLHFPAHGARGQQPAARFMFHISLLTTLDVVFPVLHGTFGEDGTLQGLLELAEVAYVGAGPLGSSLGMDKGIFKDVMRAQGIPVLESLIVLRSEIERDLNGVVERAGQLAGYPLFVKPANLGSSVGITRCSSRGDLVEGLLEAARYDRRVLVERGVNGREIEISVLGNDEPQASIPGEILPSREFYSYEAKYVDGSSGLLIPAPIPAEVAQNVQSLAVRAYRAIDCAGMARVDFLLDRESGDLFLNEVNTIPGFTQISMYPKLWEASGLPYPALLDRLVELALERKAERDRTERKYRRES